MRPPHHFSRRGHLHHLILEAGAMYRIPGCVKHRVVELDGTAKALDFFYPIRNDYL